jgi:hypothetical protein
MRESNFNQLLGKTIRSIKSSFVIIENNGTEFIEFRMDYKSYFVIDAPIKWRFQKIFIDSDWHENPHGQDLLSISLRLGEVYSGTEAEYLNMPYTSTISIWNGFKVRQIDLYGYNTNFNQLDPTKHILLLKAFDERKILIRPETAALGLIFTFNDDEIDHFFNKSLRHELIFHVSTFAIDEA